jgi:spectinomycin phosphotransferase
MLEKPELPEIQIASVVEREYGLSVSQIIFLPLGYDIHTAVYRVETQDSQPYFLKLRKGVFYPITVELPKYLFDTGLQTIIAPIETRRGLLYGQMAPYTTIVYPFIPGKDGYEVQLTDPQWILLGRTLKAVHAARLPAKLHDQIPSETYDPQWRNSVIHFLDQIVHENSRDPISSQLAAFMFAKRELIGRMIHRANELAGSLQGQPMEFVLCHSDAHPGNYHVTEKGDLYLVDWDNPIYAPRERDLMCFGGGMSGDQPGGREEHLFYQGYGGIVIHQAALAYYRYERIIQDIAEFCKQIFLSDSGDEDRAQSYQYLVNSFQPGSVVEAAISTDTQVCS